MKITSKMLNHYFLEKSTIEENLNPINYKRFNKLNFMFDCIENPDMIEKYKNRLYDRDRNNNTCLIFYLIYSENPDDNILKYLSHNIKQVNCNGMTALMIYSAIKKNPEKRVIEFLREEMGLKDSFGKTALYYLLRNKCNDINIIKLFELEFSLHISRSEYYLSTHLMTYMKYSDEIKFEIVRLFSRLVGFSNERESALSLYLVREEVDEEIVVYLKSESNIEFRDGRTPLIIYLSTKNPQLNIIRNLITIDYNKYKCKALTTYILNNRYPRSEIVDFLNK